MSNEELPVWGKTHTFPAEGVRQPRRYHIWRMADGTVRVIPLSLVTGLAGAAMTWVVVQGGL
jgi:hypothetical protein